MVLLLVLESVLAIENENRHTTEHEHKNTNECLELLQERIGNVGNDEDEIHGQHRTYCLRRKATAFPLKLLCQMINISFAYGHDSRLMPLLKSSGSIGAKYLG
jgi:hypothetical protein